MKLRTLTASAFLLALLAFGAAGTHVAAQTISHTTTAAAGDPPLPNPMPPPPGPSF